MNVKNADNTEREMKMGRFWVVLGGFGWFWVALVQPNSAHSSSASSTPGAGSISGGGWFWGEGDGWCCCIATFVYDGAYYIDGWLNRVWEVLGYIIRIITILVVSPSTVNMPII